MNHNSVFVSANIENKAIVADEVHRCPELPLYLRWTLPLRFRDDREPCPERPFSLGMPLPELL
jgi:hypothetical protein